MAWRLKWSPRAKRRTRARARAAAREYLSGRKIRRHESPAMIAKHGRDPWPPRKAAADAYGEVIRNAKVAERYPTSQLWRHRQGRRARIGRRGWTLRRAGVGRDRATGQFTRRR